MRKDYVEVNTSHGQNLDDLTFVDQFWTERWQDAGLDKVGSRVSHLLKRQEYQIMQRYLKLLPTNAKLLDAGCGLGEWAVLLKNQGFDVTGLDISQPAIDALCARFPQIDFVHGDIRQMNFPTDHFDALFSWGAFEHFELGLQPCLLESWRVLKPGGYLLITVPYHNLRHLWREVKQWESWKAELSASQQHPSCKSSQAQRFYQWRFTPSELARELVIAGFSVCELTPVQFLEGVTRALELDLKLKPNTVGHRTGLRFLRRVLPPKWVSHMIMAVAQKPLM